MSLAQPKQTLYVLTGPTAVGKTELAIQWAKNNDAEILSCDSLLVYKGMDIGTAKPTQEELKTVKHWGIDLVEVKEQYSVKRYIEYAQNVIQDIHSRDKKVLITGGTGFYLKSFYAPVVDNWPEDSRIREQVRIWEKEEGINGIVERLRKLNPEGLGELDIFNPRRVTKALERCMATGENLISLKKNFEELPYPFEAYLKRTIQLDRTKEYLKERVLNRTKRMLGTGLLEEVRKLLSQGILENLSAANAIGYKETIRFFEKYEDSCNVENLLEEIVQNTLKLVKKQKTWFRTQMKVDFIIDLDQTHISLF